MRNRSYNRDVALPENTYYEHDINYALAVCRWVLRPIGVWSIIYSHTNKLEKLVSLGLLITCFSGLLFLIVPCFHYVLFEENARVKERLIAPIIFSLASAIKYCYLVLRGTVFGSCIVHIEKDWKTVENSRHRGIMLQRVSVSRNLSALCAAFLYTAGFSYHTIMPLFSKGKAKGNGTERSLAYPVYDAFFDTQSSPTYEIIFSIQFLTSFIRYSITLGVFSLLVLCVTHICGQIEIQISRLELLIEDMQKKSKRNSLAIIVQDHAEILRFSKNVENILDVICLTQITESTSLICLLSYYCLKDWQNRNMIAISTYSIYIISFTFNILIFCYTGEILSEQCSRIGPAAYEVEWYNLPPKEARDLVLLNAISLYPPKLMGGKIIQLSMKTFVIVLKTAMVNFNLLRALTE